MIDIKSKWITGCLALLLCCILIMTAALVPGGGRFLARNRMDSLNAGTNLRTAGDTLIESAVNTAMGQGKIRFLPMNNLPCPVPSEEARGFYIDEREVEHETYDDGSVSVDCWSFYASEGISYGMIHAARVKIAHPSQLRTAFAGGAYGENRRTVREIASSVNAVVAVNGDYYNYPNSRGTVLRNGVLYRDDPFPLASYEILTIDSDGNLVMHDPVEWAAAPLYREPGSKIIQILNFGPAMVVDGVAQYSDLPNFLYLLNPRTVIAQTGPLEYLLVTADGRIQEADGTFSSPGWNINDLAVILADMGCVTAYNLDGGQSTALYFNGEIKSALFAGERELADIIFFATLGD